MQSPRHHWPLQIRNNKWALPLKNVLWEGISIVNGSFCVHDMGSQEARQLQGEMVHNARE